METPDLRPDIGKVESNLRVHMNDFRMLMDPDDEAFLRKRLPRAEFSRLKRHRIRVAWRCVRRIANHAATMRRTAEGLMQDSNMDIAESATNAVDMASHIRRQCRIAYTKLAVEYMFPAISIGKRI